jgi:hypothetical protein
MRQLPDSVWSLIRFVLTSLGSGLTTTGYLTSDDIQTGAGAIVTLLTIAWGVYVKVGTRAVPITTAQRADVPTISPVTGQTIPGPQYTK